MTTQTKLGTLLVAIFLALICGRSSASMSPPESQPLDLVFDASEAALYPLASEAFMRLFAQGEAGQPLSLQAPRAANFNKEVAKLVGELDWWNPESPWAHADSLARRARHPTLQAVGVALASRRDGDDGVHTALLAVLSAERPMESMLLPACAVAAAAAVNPGESYFTQLADIIIETGPTQDQIIILIGHGVLPSVKRVVEVLSDKKRPPQSEREQAALAWLVLAAGTSSGERSVVMRELVTSWKEANPCNRAVRVLLAVEENKILCEEVIGVIKDTPRESAKFVSRILQEAVKRAGEHGVDCLKKNLKVLWKQDDAPDHK